jgi:hypothetical protein
MPDQAQDRPPNAIVGIASHNQLSLSHKDQVRTEAKAHPPLNEFKLYLFDFHAADALRAIVLIRQCLGRPS